MFDLQTYTVYVFLLFLALFLLKSNYTVEPKIDVLDNKFPKTLFVITVSIIVGFRYEVGVDWLGYKNDYDDILKYGSSAYSSQYYEIGYFLLTAILVKLKLSSVWLFLLLAFISWTVIIKSIPNIFLAWTVFFLFSDEFFFWSMNGVRQFVALAFWLYALSNFNNKDRMKYFLIILLGGMFHYSLFFIALLYFMPYSRLLNIRLYLILFILTFLIGQFSGDYYSQLIKFTDEVGFSQDSTSFRYARYMEGDKYISDHVKLGIGFYLKIIINFLIIILGFNLIDKRPEYKHYLVLFFVGSIMFNLFYESQIIGRVMIFFTIIRPILLGVLVVYFWKRKQYKLFLSSLVFIYFILYLASIYNNSNGCSPYKYYLG